MLRRGAAAPAENRSASRKESLHLVGEIRWPGPIYRLAIVQHRQPRVGLCQNRNSRYLRHLTHQPRHLIRPRGTVDPHNIRPHALEHDDRSGRLCPIEGSSILVVGQTDHDRQITGLLYRQKRCPTLLKTHHGLHHKEIHAL